MPDSESSDLGEWFVTSASVAGTSHRRIGRPCQDSSYYRVDGEVLIAAVADGAGSAALSEIGSAIAAETSVCTAKRLLHEHHDHTPHPRHESCLKRVVTSAIMAARHGVKEESLRLNVDPAQMATTLILAVHTGNLLAVAQIGDGAVVVSEGPGSFTTFIAPQRGEYANLTNFLTSSDTRSRPDIRVERVGDTVTRLAMFTDGLQNLVLRAVDDSPHAPFFDPVFSWISSRTDPRGADKELAGFLESPRVTNRADDDLTLLLATLVE